MSNLLTFDVHPDTFPQHLNFFRKSHVLQLGSADLCVGTSTIFNNTAGIIIISGVT